MIACMARAVPVPGFDADAFAAFVESRRASDGGFAGRAGTSDLYYTVFGLDCLVALGRDVHPERLAEYLRTFGDGEGMDFMHLCCLARCWAGLADLGLEPGPVRDTLAEHVGRHRSDDGGFAPQPDTPRGTVFGAVFGGGAMEDLGCGLDRADELQACIRRCRCSGGGYANDSLTGVPTTPTTAGALMVLHGPGREDESESLDWLKTRQGPDGGLRAAEVVPAGDLLSTGVGLYALFLHGVPLRDWQIEAARRFVFGRRTPEGGFFGSVADPTPDCEYAFYALLALGSMDGGHGT
jgi:hypothetical protein